MKKIQKLFSLQGKNVVVAGGAGQIGFAMVQILADAGAMIYIADIDSEMATEKIEKDTSLKDKVKVVKLDVSNSDSIAGFDKDLGGIPVHGLVNCFHFKGNTRKLDTTSNFFSGFEHYPEEAWNLVHDVNLKGSFLLSQKLLPKMKNNNASIVNISSTYGIVSANKSIYGTSGINSPVAYATSKAALINLTRYMATHLADEGIRVNCLSPGGVFNNQAEDFLKNYCDKTPLKRMAKAEDYQGAIVYLISSASSYMTGANLVVDGGWTAW
ncbi:MAG: SDR family oxidoreductase [Flavobacteriaceae bacterium]|nr:MAG: SDR family oxidoreductase [Flavobacteriaceae bacterium]